MRTNDTADGSVGEVLWRPPNDGSSRIEDFTAFAGDKLKRSFDGFDDLWAWSVESPSTFWEFVWDYFTPPAGGTAVPPLPGPVRMPEPNWFPDLRLNYAEVMLALPGRADDDVVVTSRSDTRPEIALTAAELRDLVARARQGLLRCGVQPGDRVAAYAPNVPETVVLMLASASLGAVFCSCAPEFGVRSVTDRLRQVEPKLLLVVDGYRYGNKDVDRRAEVREIVDALPSLAWTVDLAYLAPTGDGGPQLSGATLTWDEFISESAQLTFNRLPFGHPLYVLFSSGTTGLPKPIVHGHGGITIEHLKFLGLHLDLGPSDTFFWFTTTGWTMWNILVSGLGLGATIVLYDGDPVSTGHSSLWEVARDLRITYFGVSAPFLLNCSRNQLDLREVGGLDALRFVGSTGAPLSADGFRWVYANAGPTVQLQSIAGGTDVCSAFVGANPMLPIYAGLISGRCLGSDPQAVDTEGNVVTGTVGEMVVRNPMPSMPIGFWGDDGSRYRRAYFEDFPGWWRHGDWIEFDTNGACVISGRSDATLNRGGVRLGTAEFYAVLDGIADVHDSLVVHLEDRDGGPGRLLLLVSLSPNHAEAESVSERIRRALRVQLSPRHVPEDIIVVPVIARTLTGKRLEIPVKRILQGTPVDEAVALGSVKHPEMLSALSGLLE
ncbi:acetoacetate--CoA ligase [Rhodococcus globerulus]|uniref:Acetoacetate--CoA ligase n=1 Tax=Rhodococcus globerulus TaxID=33008 RepID=A0ABU4C3V9_RHOGO|nr:acetoacetate--CoA ligase [Rhodococcus globerulus]MDV6271192.1 acetoacetate--CoA ligase [Rhodococcus globerulus]